MSLVPEFPSIGTANESLAQTLVIGNVSGPNDIAMSGGQKVDFATDISLKNGVGGDVVIDAIPLNSGPLLTEALFYDVATNKVLYQLLAPNSETLSQTLVLGNTTGSTNIQITNGQAVLYEGDIQLINNGTGVGTDVVIKTVPANPGPAPLTEALYYDPTNFKVYTQPMIATRASKMIYAGNSTVASGVAPGASGTHDVGFGATLSTDITNGGSPDPNGEWVINLAQHTILIENTGALAGGIVNVGFEDALNPGPIYYPPQGTIGSAGQLAPPGVNFRIGGGPTLIFKVSNLVATLPALTGAQVLLVFTNNTTDTLYESLYPAEVEALYYPNGFN